MEIDAIKKLIETDEKTRAAVQAQYQKRNDLKKSIDDEKKKLAEDTWKQVNQQVDETKKELDAKIKADAEESQKYFEEASKALQDMYDANKVQWQKEIVDNIIHGE